MDKSGYQIQKTGDGSITLYSAEHDDFMHSLTGGLTEAMAMHVLPSRVFETPRQQTVIFDIGFGLGYNTFAALESWISLEFEGDVLVHAFERDELIIPYITRNSPVGDGADRYAIIKEAATEGSSRLVQGCHTFELVVHFGDARRTLPLIVDRAHAVFQDPYTPSKNPELWTVDFFSMLKERIEDQGMITTYSRAPQVRGALHHAGFFLGPGPGSGMKSEGTLASPEPFRGCFLPDEIIGFLADHRSIPYKDPGLKAPAEEILENRIADMKKFRENIAAK